MLAAGIALTCGILLALFEPQPVDVFWSSFLPPALYLAYVNRVWRHFWILICGFLWGTLHANWQLDQRLPGELNNKRLVVVGEVVNIPRQGAEYSRFLLRIHRVEGENHFPGLVRLSWRAAPPQLAAGQLWRLHVKLKQPHGFQNPGGFDYERWLFVRGVDATGYVRTHKSNRMLRDVESGLTQLRSAIRRMIVTHCAGCQHVGLVQALTIGYRGDMAHAERLLLQQTGTAHLIAISGLHIGIAAGWFFSLGRILWSCCFYRGRLNRREFALSLGWVAALVYSLLSGFELPAQRAMLMLTIVFAALWLRLPVNLLSSVFMALIAVLIVSPLSVLSPSFWLTFSALFVICLGVSLFARNASMFRHLLVYQLLFTLLLAPVSIVIFDQLHAASLFANLVAVPLISLVVVPFNFVLQLLGWMPSAWLSWLYRMQDAVLGWLLDYLQWLQDLGLQAIFVGQMSLWQWLALVGFLLLLVLPRGFPVARGWLLLLPLIFLNPHDRVEPPYLRVAVLDVGMGTSIVVSTAEHHLVYDFGAGREQGFSLGSWVVQPFLQQHGIEYVDRLVISHADQDHLGGFLAIRHALNYGSVYTGTLNEVRQKWPDAGRLNDCRKTPPWRWDGVDFQFLSPGLFDDDSENNRSCVLRIRSPAGVILIAGDIESGQETRLLDTRRELLEADILVAPHHGSLTSSSPAFVAAVAPSKVIFTVGYLNRWGFPRSQVVQRYTAIDAEILRTDLDGAILIECEHSHCESRAYRTYRPRLWY